MYKIVKCINSHHVQKYVIVIECENNLQYKLRLQKVFHQIVAVHNAKDCISNDMSQKMTFFYIDSCLCLPELPVPI